jgi:ABC-type antimicrobial peptide transport system permease subunit
VSTLRDAHSELVAEPRLYMLALGLFASVALVLALVGLYGVVSYLVSWRTHEIGVRMAIGANASKVLRLFLGQGMSLVALGTALGVAGAVAATRLLRAYLFGVSPTDPATFLTILAFVFIVAVAASIVPARRATRVDPVTALKAE